ncbi:hypothetical protein BDQ17DRAFT_1357400 [Cyathus striatus]|nr:hypothetical protein BDQ17DRAFT_1357400 [Cyathus striatus]
MHLPPHRSASRYSNHYHPSKPVFPPEILLQIMRYISCPKTLCSLIQTSFFFRDNAEKILYSGDITDYNEWSREKHMHFLDTILNTPRLAALVQVYSVQEMPKDYKFSTLLRASLAVMKNLKELSYESCRLVDVLENYLFFQYKHIFRFIANQHNLTKLTLQRDMTRSMIATIRRSLSSWMRDSSYSFTQPEEEIFQIIENAYIRATQQAHCCRRTRIGKGKFIITKGVVPDMIDIPLSKMRLGSI